MIRPFKSTSIDSANYDYSKNSLSLKFKDGSLYTYQSVPIQVYHGLLKAKSKGAYHSKVIRNTYKVTKS